MTRMLVPLAAAAAMLGGASAALAEGETVVAYGTGQARVTPANPKGETSIRNAVAEARAKLVPAAIDDARVKALAIGAASGLNVGAIFQVAEQSPSPFLYGGGFIVGPGGTVSANGAFVGPFNGNFCGVVTRPIVKRTRVNGRVRVKVVRRVRERRCVFPPVLVTTLEATFRATPKV